LKLSIDDSKVDYQFKYLLIPRLDIRNKMSQANSEWNWIAEWKPMLR